MDAINEIKKWKEMLDSGTITQEEFDLQKKRIFQNDLNGHSDYASCTQDTLTGKQIVLNKLSSMEITSGVIWLVIAVIQIIGGLFTGLWFVAICGAWNVYAGYSTIKQSKAVLVPNAELVNEYRKSKTQIVVFMIINLTIGGVIGVVGCIYDLFIRDYVLKNAHILTPTSKLEQSNN